MPAKSGRSWPSRVILQQIESALRELGTNRESLIQEEYQLQGADDISVRNIINAMRLVSNIDWADFVEDVSLVDVVLKRISRIWRDGFSRTRDRYRSGHRKSGAAFASG